MEVHISLTTDFVSNQSTSKQIASEILLSSNTHKFSVQNNGRLCLSVSTNTI